MIDDDGFGRRDAYEVFDAMLDSWEGGCLADVRSRIVAFLDAGAPVGEVAPFLERLVGENPLYVVRSDTPRARVLLAALSDVRWVLLSLPDSSLRQQFLSALRMLEVQYGADC